MTNITRRSALTYATLGTLSACASAGFPVAGSREKPNIIFIMADDLGYADLSCYGRDDFSTPHLDRLAKSGVKLTSSYANSPVCSATRTALITGRYQYRLPVGMEEPLGLRDMGIPLEHATLPSLLKNAGYTTSLVGKWHLGMAPEYSPLRNGYDTFWGFRGGGLDYFTHSAGGRHDLWDGDLETHEVGYMTDLIGNHSVELIDNYARGGKPFFLSVHFSAPHWPWETPNDEAEAQRLAQSRNPWAIAHYDGGDAETYAAMVKSLDDQVGRILRAVERNNLESNTIIVFTSDNGGERFSKIWPFSGRKGELLEGGLRVPTLVRWPGVTTAGSTSAEPVMSMDWLPTFLAAAGGHEAPDYPSDGIDVTSALAGGTLPERTLCWRYKFQSQEACRKGKWKYLKIAGNTFLFNVEADPLERANRKHRDPEIYADLVETYQSWNGGMLQYTPETFSHGMSGAEIADRYGVVQEPPNIPQLKK